MKELSLKEQATNFATMRHIERVRNLLNIVIRDLMSRAENHDQSKLESPEVEAFTEYTPKLAKCTYGSEEYKGFLEAIKPALDHHYANNTHHPEHFVNGVDDMSLLDLIEMFCDWKAAGERHNDGNLLKSIEINSKRFKLSKQLEDIFNNTAKLFDGSKGQV